MIELLFVALVAAAILSLWDAAVIFALCCVAHDIVFSRADGLMYFGSAAAFDGLALVIIGFTRYNIGRCALQILCIASMVINFAGWSLWFNGVDGNIYQSMMVSVYLAAILIMSWSLKNGNPGANSWRFLLRFLDSSSNRVLDKD